MIVLDTHVNANIPQHDTSQEWKNMLSNYYKKPKNKLKKEDDKHKDFQIN